MAWGDLLLELGRITDTTLTAVNKAIRSHFEGLGPSAASDTFGPVGWFARPKRPVTSKEATPLNPSGHCEAVGWNAPDAVHPIAFRDVRLNAQVNPSEGDVGMVGYGGGFITIQDNTNGDGSTLTLYALRKGQDGKPAAAHVMTLDTTSASSNIQITHESGATVQLHKDGGVYLASKDATSWLQLADGSNGCVVGAPNTTIAGGVMLGNSDPANVSMQPLVKWAQFSVWQTQVDSTLAQLKLLLETTGLPVAGSVAKAATGPTLPSATPQATSNVRGY